MTDTQDLYQQAAESFFQLASGGSERPRYDVLGQVFSQLAVLDEAQTTVPDHNHDDLYYRREQVDILLLDKSDVGHNHDDRYYTSDEVDDLIIGHNHDDRYYTETELDNGALDSLYPSRTELGLRLAGYARLDHKHRYEELLNGPDLYALPYSPIGHNHRIEIEAVAHEFILAGQIFGG